MYRERPSTIAGAQVWTGMSDGSDRRVLPDGCMDLLWVDEHLVVAGPDVTAFTSTTAAGTVTTGLRFAPGAAPTALGVGATECRGSRVPLAALWPDAKVRHAEDLVGASDTPGRVLEDLVIGLGRGTGGPDPLAAEITRRSQDGERVASIAAAVGLSTRQLHRRSLDLFGYGPKTLGRILRLVAALDLARRGVPLATVAARCGYADQPHFAADTRALTGTTLGGLGLAPGGQSARTAGSAAKRSTGCSSGSRTTA